MKKYKIGFDIGGVLSTHTAFFRDLLNILEASANVEIYIVTDIHPDIAKALLLKNHFIFDDKHILYADWSKSESYCKEVVCKSHDIDILFDDHLPYLTPLSSTLGMLVMPKVDMPYNSSEWHTEHNETNIE